MQSFLRCCFSKAKQDTVPDDAERCTICLESLGENTENTATLLCGHTFHGSCLCKALWEKRCCPLCRLKPPAGMSESDTDDEEEEELRQGVPFTDAMKLARDAAKIDKRTANMFTTLKKWEKQYKDSRKLYVHTKRKLKNLRDVPVQQKVEDYRKKQIDKFNKKHPKLLAKYKKSHKMLWHANNQFDKTGTRIAKKYGYIP